MAETLLSYDVLKAFCWEHGFHAEIHQLFNSALQRPGRENACWYLQPSIKKNGETTRTTLLKYSTAEEVYDHVLEHVRQEAESSQ